MSELKLMTIIEKNVLQEIQDKFSEATGLAAIIADDEGRGITKPSKFCDFCKIIRSVDTGQKLCFCSDEKVGRKAAKTGKVEIHHCHCGLIDLAAPVIVDHIHYGSVLCGQVLLQPPDPAKFSTVEKLSKELNLNCDLLLHEFRKIPIVNEERVKASADLLHIISNYIVQMGISRITQQKLLHEEKMRAENEKTMRILELKTLQSQLNPHFLFNTLNAVAKQAMLENAQKTVQIVTSFARLLRYNLRKADKTVLLAEEIESIKNYFFIQKTRYGNRINYEISIEEELMNLKIPFMLLQPIVENAIIHGVDPKIEGGNITITGKTKNDKAELTVHDTGLGMSQNRLSEILDNNSTSGQGHITGIGLSNLQQRLKLHYNSSCEFHIASTENQGTAVNISIPLENIKDCELQH